MLKRSIQILNKNILFVVGYAAIEVFKISLTSLGQSPVVGLILVIVICAQVILMCGIFSSLWQYAHGNTFDFFGGMGENILNFFKAGIVMVILGAGLSLAVASVLMAIVPNPITPDGTASVSLEIMKAVFASLIAPLFIYIMPYVFTRGEGFLAVFLGVKFLISNLVKSLPVILIVFFNTLFWTLLNILSGFIKINIMGKIILFVLSSFIIQYILFLRFLLASFILNETEAI